MEEIAQTGKRYFQVTFGDEIVFQRTFLEAISLCPADDHNQKQCAESVADPRLLPLPFLPPAPLVTGYRGSNWNVIGQ